MASLKDRAKKSKTLFTLDTPTPTFSTPQWPDITPKTSSTISTALLTLLSDLQELQSTATTSPDTNIPIISGINPVTAHLENLTPQFLPHSIPPLNSNNSNKEPRKPLAILATRSDAPSALLSHLPFLAAITSTPLLSLPKGTEQKLLKLLKPKSNTVYTILLFHDTPEVSTLKSLIHDGENTIGSVSLPGILSQSPVWTETRCKSIQTSVGERKPKRKPEDAKKMDNTDASNPSSKKAKKEG
ncbi:hypothetical protein TWF481_009424 [Arthrobotrys musiformis]|uniref:Uncharacterized protein n=1 Tax=Arthrobotrys musiformis TaxID=47236 RepID=A0AAV9W5H4_9PEZI